MRALARIGVSLVIAFICAYRLSDGLREEQAREAGFESYADQRRIEDAAPQTADQRQAERDAALAAEAAAEVERLAEAAEAERRRQEAEENVVCRKDIQCWGEKAWKVAALQCTDLVEMFVKYDQEWTDGMQEPKFARFQRRDVQNGHGTVIGDKIKFQNGFGAWSHMIYECVVDPAQDLILDARVEAQN